MGFSPRARSNSSVWNLLAVESPTCTDEGRKYAGASKVVANLIAIKSSLRTRYGKLCQEPTGTAAAFSSAWESVNGGPEIWAQSGFSRDRGAGVTTITTCRYSETNGARGWQFAFDFAHAPAEGTTHEYKCELNTLSGAWTFFYDGAAWDILVDEAWKSATNTIASWKGEILNIEDDMPGTSSNKCNFTACQFRRVGAQYESAGITAGDVTSSNANAWGAEAVGSMALNIWDKTPLP
jgi:hypothetical protein